ncbi:MAG: transcriptional repressor [Anaerovoracaceae bacterium]
MNYSKQRDLILKIIRKNRVHPTADWICAEAKKKMPAMGIATVYRNLNILTELGQINKIVVPGEADRFDGFVEEHYHMKCEKCGNLIDLQSENIDSVNKLKEMINTTFNVEGSDAHLCSTLLSGTCNDCASAK